MTLCKIFPDWGSQSESMSSEHLDEKASVESAPIAQDDQSIPNGGIVAWLQVLGSFFMLFNVSGIINSFGVFQSYYEDDVLKNENPSRIAWIGSFQACLILFVGALTGPLFDMGYFRYMLAIGTFMGVLSLMMTSLCREYWQFMLGQSLCMGLGGACLFVPGLAITSTYFSSKRSLAVGIAASGSSSGAVVYSIMFHRLVSRIGFPWTVRAMGFMALGLLIISNVVMRPRIAPSHRRSLFIWQAFKEPAYCIYMLGIFLGYTGVYIPFFHVTSYALRRTSAGPSLSFYLVAILNGASIFGRILPSFLADKIGPFNTIIILAFCSTVLAFGWMGIQSLGGIIIFAILYGFMTGGYVALPAPCITSITANLHEVGSRVGMCFLFAGIGMLIGSPIAGALVNLKEASFWKAQLCCAMLLVGSTSCFVLTRICLSRNPLARK